LDLKKTLKALKLNESTISMFLGALVIVVVGVLIINFFSGKKQGEIIPAVSTEDLSSSELPTTHTVAEGEDLWRISERYYGSGYNWTDIASENNIQDPENIESGQQLTIPNVEAKITTVENANQTPTSTLIPIETPVHNERVTQITSGRVYVVKEGDNLWEIAEENMNSGYDWVEIAQANNLDNPGMIEEGQELTIPAVKTTNDIASLTDSTYKVEAGDNLWEIAVRAYGDGYKWVEIANANNLDNPDIIHPGNELTLPR